ncbi:hypothetical protein Fmac_003556 [Flemingia macrophylla]|uniref:PUM-HD domain-containing protein n=1 Tax=Flemingia macrophylla TaxID=520843 RepID=A0ABD1NN31_9FABA
MVLWQDKDHLCDLMMDQYFNSLIQSVFEVSSVDHITIFLGLIIQNDHKLMEVCMHNHGTRAIQKLLGNLKTQEQIRAVIFAVKRITVKLSKNINGEGDAMTQLIEKIVSHALVFTEHPFGNYVVQYVVKMKEPFVNATTISQLLGRFAQLSMNRQASIVVENLLEFSEEKAAAIIIQEIMCSANFVRILQDPCGNYMNSLGKSKRYWTGYITIVFPTWNVEVISVEV